MTYTQHATAALADLDQLIEERPHSDGVRFSAATRHVTAMRDTLIGEGRRERLEHVNAIISLLLAGHFPLGEVPWDEIVKARAWLAELAHG